MAVEPERVGAHDRSGSVEGSRVTASATTPETSDRWLPAEGPVAELGTAFGGGPFYAATGGEEPSSIDPTLSLGHRDPDWAAETVSRPPRYDELGERARAAYAIWLRTGRRSPRAPTVWPLLYLYGLERRVLLDGDDDPALREEADALGRVYGHDPAVRRIVEALTLPRSAEPPRLVDEPLPDGLQVELGRRALASLPVDGAWALAWAWFHPDVPRLEAATHARETYARLWLIRFSERYPDGLVVRPRRRRLTLEYVPENPSLPTPLEITVADASDVFLTPGPLRALRELSGEVETELEAYVRWRVRHDDDDPGAAAVLPRVLLEGTTLQAKVAPALELVNGLLGSENAVLHASDPIIAAWQRVSGQERFSRADAVALAQILERDGLGIEPDVRFGGRPISDGSAAALFRLDGPPSATPSTAYATAVITLELCAAVAAADGTLHDAERALLVEQVGRVEGLTTAERSRLAAHELLLTRREVYPAEIAPRIADLPLEQREHLGRYLVEIARVDGVVTEDEHHTVRSVYGMLGLDPASADADLGIAPAPELTVSLDEHRLRATQASNNDVRDLLSAIFDDEEETGTPPPPDVTAVGTLDARHSALLADLAARGRATRADLEALASRHGVLPDGALDVINEAALDLTEEPVVEIEDDDSVTIAAGIYEEMRA